MPSLPGSRACATELRELLGRIRCIEAGGVEPAPEVSTGWTGAAGPTALGRRLVHEWFGSGRDGPDWRPPTSVLVHLARQAWCEDEERGWVAWVGRRVWPYPHTLARVRALRPHEDGTLGAACDPEPDGEELLERSIFVDPPDAGTRLWAIDLALRCPAVAVVVADGGGLAMAATRRLQLAAEAGRGLALLARAPWELATRSAAATRWQVETRAVSGSSAPRFAVRLLHAKGRARAGLPQEDSSGADALAVAPARREA